MYDFSEAVWLHWNLMPVGQATPPSRFGSSIKLRYLQLSKWIVQRLWGFLSTPHEGTYVCIFWVNHTPREPIDIERTAKKER